MHSVTWQPADKFRDSGSSPNAPPNLCASIGANAMRLWNVEVGGQEVASTPVGAPCKGEHAALGALGMFCCGSWDPHHPSELATAMGGELVCWDLRSFKPSRTVNRAHSGQQVRSVHFNPNKPHYVVSGGDDGKVKFWDLRMPSADDRAVLVLRGHDHWVTMARYNRFHDQLLCTAGTDGLVKLWRVSSVSSAPLLDLADADGDVDAGMGGVPSVPESPLPGASFREELDDARDGLVSVFDDHHESVSAVEWSASDAWVFLSLSFPGDVRINHVPSVEKYKILL
jgi:WD40 repeat protein